MQREMKSYERKVALVNLALVVFYLLGKLSSTNAQDDCLPGIGRSGDLRSVVLIIQTWEARSQNYHFDDPVMMSSETFTVPKSSTVSRLGGANVRFYGEELCVAVTKVTEVDKEDGTTDRSSVCLKSCFGVGSGTRLDTYSGTFGRITSTDPPCCLSGKIKTLRFSIPAPPTTPPPAYQCTACTGCEDSDARRSTETCRPGDKCFTLKLQKQKDGEIVAIKGCSYGLRYWGKHLDCDDQCKNDVRLWPDRSRHYSVCVSCCSGDKCNDKKLVSGAGCYGHILYVTIITFFVTVLGII